MNQRRLALVAAPLVAVLLYLPALGHEFVFDDRGIVENNPLVVDAGSWWPIFSTPYWNAPGHDGTLYRPLTTLSFAVDHAIAGLNPSWYHGVNVLLHALVVFMVTLLALAILPSARAAAITGILFAVHPVHVEAVAGVVGRSELLAAAGVLGAIFLHRRALCTPGPAYLALGAGSWGAALLGMMSKESAVLAPLLCGLSDWALPSHPDPGRRRRLFLYGGQLVMVGLYMAARVQALGALGIGGAIPFVDNPAATAGAWRGRLTGVASVARYALLLVFPARLSADYSYDQIPVARGPLDAWVLAGALVIAAVAGGLWLRKRHPVAGLALLWIGASSLLTTNLILFIGTLLAERLMYLPSLGVSLLAGWLVAVPRGRHLRALLTAICFTAALGAAGRSAVRLRDWHDDFTLYRSAARTSPRSARIRYNLGNAYLRQEEYASAEENYRRALAIYPEFSDARANLGMALLQQGRSLEAVKLLEASVRAHPQQADLRVNLGMAYRAAGNLDRAEAEYRRALEIDPRSSKALNNLGAVARSRGLTDEAVDYLRRAVDLEPGSTVLRINLADALTAAGRRNEAATEFREAYRRDRRSAEAERGMGEVALWSGDREEAEARFRVALDMTPPSARAANYLGYLLTLRGDTRAAIEAYERAIDLDPTLADAHRSLGLLYARDPHERDRAVRHFETALRLDPDQSEAVMIRKALQDLRR